ncbi:hypothetical protein DSM112329_04493 [Paraconexibacter sp. AEG42_29]|uniref:Guanylate cyclase domain-containing protein n=1 Tax=Paraconexibacter sp. AEG42_29 TaxID=2997339 RepID=A0AAU7B152_9ACTN
MRGRRQRQRTALLLLVAALAGTFGAVGHGTSLMRRPELASVDARFGIRGTQAPPSDVVVVALDDASIDRLDQSVPIQRRLHARVIDRLSRAGAKVIAYDFDFLTPTTARDDNALITALRRARGVILAATQITEDGETDTLGGDETRAYARVTVATPNFLPPNARRATIRRLPLDVLGVPNFAVAVARRAGAAIPRDEFDGDGMWIDFPGPEGTFTTLPFADVVEGRRAWSAAAVRGKVVIVGASASVIQDVRSTPLGDGVPGAEINAAAVSTLLRGAPLRDAPGWLAVLWVLGLSTLTPLAALRLQALRWLPVPVVLAAAGAVVAQLAFDGGRILPVAAPGAALLSALLGTLAVAYATDLRDRRHLRAAFARYVPPSVVDEVVAQAGDDLRLGGVRREGTVLFCDLRGFTSVAEHLEPEAVVALLNVYLSEMSAALLDHGGTIVSFMGDGIMAVFGAPLVQEDHADRALRAARELLGPRLDAFNAAAGTAEPMRLGVGVCSGPVLSGNVGSQRRVEYTAVGDTTNTAARLEQMTKAAGVPILIADSTRALLHDEPAAGLEPVGDLEIRGRQTRLKAWTLA